MNLNRRYLLCLATLTILLIGVIGQLSFACGILGDFDLETQNLAGNEIISTVISESELIVVGRVIGERSYWLSDSSLIMTEYSIIPTNHITGAKVETLSVVVAGGIVGDVGLRVSSEPTLSINNEYILFLVKDRNRSENNLCFRPTHGKAGIVSVDTKYNHDKILVDKFERLIVSQKGFER